MFGRVLGADVTGPKGKVIETEDGEALKRGTILLRKHLQALEAHPEVEWAVVRSVLTCDAPYGVCRQCYGLSLATGRDVEIGEAVGIMAAQSIGEPGTQLTMRTFHTGGVAGDDITHGLPRVVELFEAREPKGKALLAELGGTVRIDEDAEEGRRVVIETPDGEMSYPLSRRSRLLVHGGDVIDPGTQLTEGPLDPKEKLTISGIRAAQQYLVDQVQEVYRSQGVEIHDKHIEMIVRQMLRKVRVVDPGDSSYLPNELSDEREFREVNRQLAEDGKAPATGRPELMGITKASLATDSWLSAASFQETTRVLTEGAIQGRSDFMRGLKENVIIGKLIPAGTGHPTTSRFSRRCPMPPRSPHWGSSGRCPTGLKRSFRPTRRSGSPAWASSAPATVPTARRSTSPSSPPPAPRVAPPIPRRNNPHRSVRAGLTGPALA